MLLRYFCPSPCLSLAAAGNTDARQHAQLTDYCPVCTESISWTGDVVLWVERTTGLHEVLGSVPIISSTTRAEMLHPSNPSTQVEAEGSGVQGHL